MLGGNAKRTYDYSISLIYESIASEMPYAGMIIRSYAAGDTDAVRSTLEVDGDDDGDESDDVSMGPELRSVKIHEVLPLIRNSNLIASWLLLFLLFV